MPTDAQIRASAGVHPVTEAFAMDLYTQAGGRLDGQPLPSGAWEHTTHEARELLRDKAREWIRLAVAGGLGMEHFRARGPGGI